MKKNKQELDAIIDNAARAIRDEQIDAALTRIARPGRVGQRERLKGVPIEPKFDIRAQKAASGIANPDRLEV